MDGLLRSGSENTKKTKTFYIYVLLPFSHQSPLISHTLGAGSAVCVWSINEILGVQMTIKCKVIEYSTQSFFLLIKKSYIIAFSVFFSSFHLAIYPTRSRCDILIAAGPNGTTNTQQGARVKSASEWKKKLAKQSFRFCSSTPAHISIHDVPLNFQCLMSSFCFFSSAMLAKLRPYVI